MVIINGKIFSMEGEIIECGSVRTKGKIIEMIELTDSSAIKIKQNININLLTTWLCGEYRRISWQR